MTMSAFGVDDERISKAYGGAKILTPIKRGAEWGRRGRRSAAEAEAAGRATAGRAATAGRETAGRATGAVRETAGRAQNNVNAAARTVGARGQAGVNRARGAAFRTEAGARLAGYKGADFARSPAGIGAGIGVAGGTGGGYAASRRKRRD